MRSGGHPVDAHVGAALRLFRIQRRMSQSDLARRVGITFQQVQKYERGANRISASKLFDFAGILGVPVQSFFEGLEADGGTRDGEMLKKHSAIDFEILRLVGQIEDGPIKARIRSVVEAFVPEDGKPNGG
jgi:transcriptional regulator with XRE-family HTH domain